MDIPKRQRSSSMIQDYQTNKVYLAKGVGNSSCNITTLGMKFPATYRIDNGYVYIHTHDGADMLFKIQDSNTLVGESLFNESTYRKIKTPSNKQDSER